MERLFFGEIDAKGRDAVTYWAEYWKPDVNGPALQDLMRYMTVQKLRTPKGLRWLRLMMRHGLGGPIFSNNDVIEAVSALQHLYSAVWSESVWQLVDASRSQMKFIISDHPVTVYNRACPPLSKWCQGVLDPDIRMAATHTYFPLSPERALILSNLHWVRDPYQSEHKLRPNSDFFRNTIFNFMGIHTQRYLSEQEVLEINMITKRRAFRYIAAAEKDWLYPETALPDFNWSKLGHGWLFMPDPRCEHNGGEILVGYEDGGAASWDEYGQRPWQAGYTDEKRREHEFKTLHRFQSEFARRFGPEWRSVNAELGSWDYKHRTDSPEYYEERVKHAKVIAREGRRRD